MHKLLLPDPTGPTTATTSQVKLKISKLQGEESNSPLEQEDNSPPKKKGGVGGWVGGGGESNGEA